jgi:hypothetical protein
MGRKKKIPAAELVRFLRQYRRKKVRNIDPNDRQYDRELEARIKRMSAEELDQLLRDEADPKEIRPPPAE